MLHRVMSPDSDVVDDADVRGSPLRQTLPREVNLIVRLTRPRQLCVGNTPVVTQEYMNLNLNLSNVIAVKCRTFSYSA